MALENDIREIKENVQNINTNSGPGCTFYLAFFLTAIMTTCGAYNTCNTAKTTDIQQIINTLDHKSLVPQLYSENTLGKTIPEKFYIINGQRAYFEIDGKLVETYQFQK